MKAQHSTRLISVLLVLSMLLGMLTVLSVGSAVSAAEAGDTAEVRPTLETTDELQFATQYYQSAWAGSSIENKSNLWSVASDGAYNGALQWNKETAATLDADGVLSFATNTGATIQYLPWQNNPTHNIQIGPARIAFEIYYDANMPSMHLQHYASATGSQKLFVLTAGSNVVKHGWGADQIGVMEDGWNTIEMIFIPLDADGVICTESTDVVTQNIFYARVIPESKKTTGDTFYSPAYLEANFFKNSGFAVKTHYRNMGATVINLTSDATKTLKVRSAMAMNLTPYIDLPHITFGGYSEYDTTVALGGNVTLPAAEGVKAWLHNNTYYLPGETFVANASAYFSPVTDEMWFGTKIHDSSTLWNNNNGFHFNGWGDGYTHNAEGYNGGVVTVYKNDTRGNYSYNAAEKAITVNSFGNNYADWFLRRYVTIPGENAIENGSDYESYAFSFDFKYTTGDFDGLKAGVDWGNTVLANVTTNGVVTICKTTLTEKPIDGWNTIVFFMTANKNGDALVSYTVFGALNPDVDGALNSPDALAGMNTMTWTTSTGINAGTNNGSSRMYIRPHDSGASADAPASLTLRSFKTYGLNKNTANTIAVENTREMTVVPTGSEYTIPTVDGIDKWVAHDIATEVNALANSGEVISVTTDYTVIGAVEDASKFGRASISLGSEMTLNMKVNPAVLTEGTLGGMMAIADGSALTGVADASLDEYGYYNIPIHGILARDMWRDLDLYLLTEVDGTYYISANAQVYSPLVYIENMYANSTDEVKALLAAMANYGAVAEESYYTGSTNMRTAMNTLGIDASAVPALPTDSTEYARAQYVANKDIINSYVMTGATLTNGFNLVLELNEKTNPVLSGVRISSSDGNGGESSKVYEFDAEGKLIIDGMSAASIRTVFTITFIGTDGADVESTQFTIGNFLELRRTNESAPEGEKALAEATIIYMMAVRNYAISETAE